MNTFQWTSYELTSKKIREESGEIRLCFLSDLHGFSHGRENENLLRAMAEHRPDGILIGGDMATARYPETLAAAEKLVTALARRAPVWYTLGNHEHWMLRSQERREAYLHYEQALKGAGVIFLHNRSLTAEVKGSLLFLSGLELEQAFFRKPHPPRLSLAHLQKLLRRQAPKEEVYSILLAHNPKYGEVYFQWGSDLTLCGHYHGGIVGISKRRGLAAPQALFLPKFSRGDFYRGEKTLVVSAGLGEHTLPLRLRNPREVVEIRLSHRSGNSPDERREDS